MGLHGSHVDDLGQVGLLVVRCKVIMGLKDLDRGVGWRTTVVLVSETAAYVVEARKREMGYELLGESEANLLAELVHHIVL